MKHQFLFMSLVFSMSAFGAPGNEGSGGGDEVVAEFFDIATRALTNIAERTESIDIGSQKLRISELRSELKSVQVGSIDEVLVQDGLIVNAQNFPKDNRIIINRGRWKQMYVNEQLRLSLHELVSVLGYNDFQYQISNQLVSLLNYPIRCSAILFGTNSRIEQNIDLQAQPEREGSVLYTGEFDGIHFRYEIRNSRAISVMIQEDGQLLFDSFSGWNGHMLYKLYSLKYPGKEIHAECDIKPDQVLPPDTNKTLPTEQTPKSKN